jgi:hypothetical protein
LEIELKEIGLGSSSGLGPTKERRFNAMRSINDTPISNNLPASHKHNSVGISCPRLPMKDLVFQ